MKTDSYFYDKNDGELYLVNISEMKYYHLGKILKGKFSHEISTFSMKNYNTCEEAWSRINYIIFSNIDETIIITANIEKYYELGYEEEYCFNKIFKKEQ